jgi:hypothetical protein
MKIKLILTTLLASVTLAGANLIPIGQVTFSGDFTLNHLYDFNDPGAQPFGTFSNQTVEAVSGIFAPFVHGGDVLPGQKLFSIGALPLFSLDGFQFLTTFVSINGPDSGRFVEGFVDLSGNGYEFDPDDFIHWRFIAPPYDIGNFHEDITGPITLLFLAGHDINQVPDGGLTLGMFSAALTWLAAMRKRM